MNGNIFPDTRSFLFFGLRWGPVAIAIVVLISIFGNR
jgi:hypothetical protein